MYGSRGMSSMGRFNDLVEQLKKEYEQLEEESAAYKQERAEMERKLESQINEFTSMRQTVYELERQHQKMKQHYEEEIMNLRQQLAKLTNGSGGAVASSADSASPIHQPSVLHQQQQQQQPPQPQSQQQQQQPQPQSIRTESQTQQTQQQQPNHKFPPMNPAGTSRPPTSTTSGQASQMQAPPSFPNTRGEEASMGVDVSGKDKNLVRKDGTDWLVVYNPTLSTDVNISLAHNLEHNSVVCCVRFSADGKYLATGSNRVAQIFDVETGKRVHVFPDDAEQGDADSYVRSVCFSPDGKYLVAGAEDRTVKVWNIVSRELVHSFEGHELDIYSLDFSSDNRFVVSGSGDGKAKIWSMETGRCQHTLGIDDNGPREGVTSVAISPDCNYVATGSLDNIVRLWDTNTGKFLHQFTGHKNSVYSVAFSPNGKTLASGSLDTTIKLWDISNPSAPPLSLGGHRDYVLSVAFSPDGNWLISGSKDRSVHFWDPRSNLLYLMLQGHMNSVISVALSQTSQAFATGSGDKRARIWKYDQSGNKQ